MDLIGFAGGKVSLPNRNFMFMDGKKTKETCLQKRVLIPDTHLDSGREKQFFCYLYF